MTEGEKMRRGLLYDANNDPELLAERARCKDLCFAYNQLPPSRTEEQEALIRRLLGRTGSGSASPRPSGAITGGTSRSAKIFTPTTTASSWTARR